MFLCLPLSYPCRKLLGSNENDEKARALALADKDPDVDYNRKRILSAPDATAVKALQVLGEKILAAEKARKILGSDEDDEKARRLADQEKDIALDVERLMRYTLPPMHTKSLKVIELLGETMLAGSKAEKILGAPMTRKQVEEMLRAEEKEAQDKEKVYEEEARKALETGDLRTIMDSARRLEVDRETKKIGVKSPTETTRMARSRSPRSPRSQSPKGDTAHSYSPRLVKRRSGIHEGIAQTITSPRVSPSTAHKYITHTCASTISTLHCIYRLPVNWKLLLPWNPRHLLVPLEVDHY